MARRTSPLKVKQHAANVRYNKLMNARVDWDHYEHYQREVQLRSRDRKVYVSAYERYKHERFIRARLGPVAAAAREDMLPMDWYRPHGEEYRGTYQVRDVED